MKTNQKTKIKIITRLCISIFSIMLTACGSGGSGSSSAAPSTAASNEETSTKSTGYLGWVFGGANLPLWVYKGTTLVAYLDSGNQVAWLGEANKTASDGTYEYLYQDSSSSTGYTGCNVQVLNGQFVTTNVGDKWCKGVVSSFDSLNGQKGNENTIEFANGKSDLYAMTPPVATLTAPTYATRELTINNNTQTNITLYFTASCSTTNTASSAPLNAQSQYIWQVPDAGVTSCNITTQAQQPTQGPFAYNTLFEATYPNINSVSAFTNVDISMVNGFNMSYSLYPSLPTTTFSTQLGYFQRDTSPNKPTPQSIFNFSKAVPASQFNPESGLQSICDSINTAMPASIFAAGAITTTSTGFEVWQNTTSQSFVGCFSPLTISDNFLSPANPDAQAQYGCTGAYGTYQTCTTGAKSAYVQQIHNDPNTKNVYAYPYDDSYADFSIDRHTSLVWDINGYTN